MSNERIDQILEESGLIKESGPFPIKADLYQRVRRAMEQYSHEAYTKGRIDQEKVEDFKQKIQIEQLARLQALVQAQKEYIELLELDAVFRSNWAEEIELRHKIKELEK